MLFNSLNFCFFLPVVVTVYYFLPYKFRWLLLLAASYFFYMCWNPYYVILIFLSTAVDYWAGLKMGAQKDRKSRLKFLLLSILINLGLLLYFKYYNFFVDSLNAVFLASGAGPKIPLMEILLPVGISFYTFQTLGYAFDVYREKREAERHFGIFALYVAFFPQLIAGPIERSTSLIPQFKKKISLVPENIVLGGKLIVWGLFKKVVIADRLAIYVDFIYSAPETVLPGTMALASIFFAFQIYCDFSGYSDIAIGSAKLLGIDLMENFRRPYFAQNLMDFWSRWHISLSTWFRDYVYFPMGGSKLSVFRTSINIIIVFAISGLWHGASWTFIIWGLLHGVSLLIYKFFRKLKVLKWSRERLGVIHIVLSTLLTFLFLTITWVFFRSESLSQAIEVLEKLTELVEFKPNLDKHSITAFLGLSVLLIAETKQEFFSERLKFLSSEGQVFSFLVYPVLIVLILTIGVFDGSQFIYFQF